MRLSGKTALVTGAGSGIGAATAKLFSEHGAAVALLDRNADAVDRVSAEIDGSLPLTADVGSSTSVEEAFGTLDRELGAVDLVVHAAGVDDLQTKQEAALLGSQETRVFTMDMSDAQWDDQLQVNLTGAFYVVRASLQRMVPRRSGSIVTISSIGGITGCFMVNYSAAKGGLLAFMRAVAQEAWSHGVRVNAIAPGLIDSPMMRRNPLTTAPPPEVGRWGRPEEVASAALFLASDDSSFVTGETLIACGPFLTI